MSTSPSIPRGIVQMFVMAAIVDTALFFPVGAVLALVALAFGVSLQALVTFDGWLAPWYGLLVWWVVLFVPALVYAATVMPWRRSDGV